MMEQSRGFLSNFALLQRVHKAAAMPQYRITDLQICMAGQAPGIPVTYFTQCPAKQSAHVYAGQSLSGSLVGPLFRVKAIGSEILFHASQMPNLLRSIARPTDTRNL